MEQPVNAPPLPEPRVDIEHEGKLLHFFTPNSTSRWRAETLRTKEPGTLSWIAEFAPGEVLFDVGANVGVYTVWAAKVRGARVYAFEPESQNFSVLNVNLLINELNEQACAYSVAVAERLALDHLYLSAFGPGSALHNFGAARDYQHRPFAARFKQGCLSVSLDELCGRFGLPVPQHIKIDVDGIEDRIVAGAREVLADRRLKSLLIEVNTNLDAHWTIIDTLLEFGFDYSQEETAQAQRTSGPFQGVGNYVFRR
jgi:FkbM family methyltransferase